MIDDDDVSLFRSEMKGVKPLQYDKAEVGQRPKDKARFTQLKQNANNDFSKEVKINGVSDQFILDTEPEEFLYWAKSGIQDAQMRRLKAGELVFEGSIDLHGMTVDQSRDLIWAFIEEAVKREVRCVRVTHGKALRKDKSKPILKSYVNTWLRQHTHVLGFSSCQSKHGGTGAVYVLLKRHLSDKYNEE